VNIRSVNVIGSIRFTWRGDLADEEVAELTRSHGGHPAPGWWNRIRPHSLGWVTARRDDGGLVGFANVAWDGSDHAFLLDPKVRPDHQRQGIGKQLVRLAAQSAADAGCEWMEVDFEEHLAAFFFEACRFRPTAAGLLHLSELSTEH
jgi:GNAT superfamily N-acetyltransferase